MASKTLYYARASSTQSLEEQLEAFKKDGAKSPDIIVEKAPARNGYPEYQAMKQHLLRPGDTLIIMSLDRLGSSKKAVRDELEHYRGNHIRVRILDIPVSSLVPTPGQEWAPDLISRTIIEVVSSQAKAERSAARSRQAEGIATAKAQGKYAGRKPKKVDEVLFQRLLSDWKAHKVTKAEMAKKLGISRATLNKRLSERRVTR